MRKIIAVIIVFLQLAFSVTLVGLSLHREKEIMRKGKDYVLDAQGFYYYGEDPESGKISVFLDFACETDPRQDIREYETEYDFWRLVTDADGISRIYGHAPAADENAVNVYSLYSHNVFVSRDLPDAFPFLKDNTFLTQETAGRYYYYDAENETEQSAELDIKVGIRVYKTEARFLFLTINGERFDFIG